MTLDPATMWWEGFFYGALGVMAAHQLAVWATLRERAGLLYVGFVLALAASTFTWDGHALRWWWPGAETWNRSAMPLLDAVTAILGIAFTRAFLETRHHTPRLDVALRGLLVLSLVTIPLTAPPTVAVSLEAVGLFTLLGPPLLLAAGVLCWRRGVAPARTYVLGQALLMIGLTSEVLVGLAPESVPAWTADGVYFGALAMVLVFAHALAERHRESLTARERLEAERHAAEQAALRDGLTGVANRRHLDGELAREWSRAARERDAVSFVLADVDFFKPYNDGYGHLAGDACLRRVAEALAGAITRPCDLVARYGGEEFAAVLPGIDAPGAHHVAERMRAAVAALAIPHAGSRAADHVTVSIGVATEAPDEDGDPKELVEAADRALYDAKEAGRNQVRPGPGARRAG